MPTMNAVVMQIPEKDDWPPSWGPLTVKERGFVWAMLVNGGKRERAVLEAGYEPGNDNVRGVMAYQLMHRPRVLQALHDGAWLMLQGQTVGAIRALEGLVLDPTHKDHAKAIQMVLDRTGFIAEQRVLHKTETQDPRELIADIRKLAALAGVPADKLLGYNSPKADVIEGEFTEVEQTEEWTGT